MVNWSEWFGYVERMSASRGRLRRVCHDQIRDDRIKCQIPNTKNSCTCTQRCMDVEEA